MSSGKAPEQARLPGIGLSHEPDIRNETQLNAQLALEPGLARLRETRRLVSRRCEMAIALPAPPAFEQDVFFARAHEVVEEFICVVVENGGPRWYVEDRRLPVAAVPVPSGTTGATLSMNVSGSRQVKQRSQIVADAYDYIAASAAVTAVRTALGDVLLSTEGDTAGATSTGCDMNSNFVYKALQESGSSDRLYRNVLAPFALAEYDTAVHLCEQGIVSAASDVHARMKASSTLPYNNRAGSDHLAAKPLHTKPLSIGVTTVLAAAATLLMCHCLLLNNIDADLRRIVIRHAPQTFDENAGGASHPFYLFRGQFNDPHAEYPGLRRPALGSDRRIGSHRGRS
jgi:hypothetical protein